MLPSTLTLLAHAKINLYLDILSRRENGYHDILSLMQTVGLCDTVTLTRLEAGAGIRLSCSHADLPTDSRNLAYRAAQKYAALLGREPDVAIHIEKRIPMAAGLAGGSADAAAVLRGLDRLYGRQTPAEELCALGAQLGADVPFCIMGGAMVARGIGEVLNPCQGLPTTQYLVIACGGEGVSTPAAYGALDERHHRFATPREGVPPLTDLQQALKAGDMTAIGARMYNIFEEVVLPTHSTAGKLLSCLRASGSSAAMMSGSGPSVFGLFESEASARRAAAAIEREHAVPAYVTTPVGIDQQEKGTTIMEECYIGRGNAAMRDEYLDFINYVFGFNGREKDFVKLLPKLYSPLDDPAGSSYVITEGGRIKAAVGAFDHEMQVCGQTLKCRSIGNVAAHPYAKSRGFMRKLMDLAVSEMVQDGVALSTLGGRRQRYNYFSYEKSGTAYRFSINSDNMRHTYGADRTAHHRFAVRSLTKGDDAALDAIAALIATQDYVPVRSRARLYDILCSWQMVPVTFWEGERFAGYATLRDGNTVTEFVLVDPTEANITDALICLYDWKGTPSLTVKFPAFATTYIQVLYPLTEWYAMELNESYSVLDFEAVIRAFFALKATYATLPDGKLTLLIHGRAGDERLTLSVSHGVPAVDRAGEDLLVDRELSHLDAINLLFSPFCPARETLPDHARLWLPLPLWMYPADEV